MVLAAYGFDGTVSESAWALMGSDLGAEYTVDGPNDFKVTAVTGADRTFAVAAGTAFGRGVLVTNSAQITGQLGTVASGSRWDLVALRRDWAGASGQTSIAVVQGGAAQAIPSGRQTNPGVGQDDQLLALVQVTAGQTIPTAVIDLRVWAGKMYQAETLLALPDSRMGAVARVGGNFYDRVNGPPLTWRRRADTLFPMNLSFGWDAPAGQEPPTFLQDSSGRVKFSGTIRNLSPVSQGDATPDVFFTLPVGYRPAALAFGFMPCNTAPAAGGCHADIRPDGTMLVSRTFGTVPANSTFSISALSFQGA